MDFSFLKALTASARGQVSSLKSQVKRLHGASTEVFGTAYGLEACQEAVAKANGYRNWKEIIGLATNLGQDRKLPAWHIHSRTASHETCLQALIQTDVEMSQSRSVVILGNVDDAALSAVTLWAEQISARKVPGIIAIDTNIRTFQKTPVGLAAKKLGLADMFQKFRVIDARESSVPLSISATASEWVSAIRAALSVNDVELLKEPHAFENFEHLITHFGQMRNRSKETSDYDLYSVLQAAVALRTPGVTYQKDFPPEDDAARYLASHLEEDAKNFPKEALENLINLVEEMKKVMSSLGIVLRHETLYRPTIVLFDSLAPVSVVIATLIQGMYYYRFISNRAIRPLLYCSTSNKVPLPTFLHFGTETIICNGEKDSNAPIWDSHSTRTPIFISAEPDGIIVSGKWAATT